MPMRRYAKKKQNRRKPRSYQKKSSRIHRPIVVPYRKSAYTHQITKVKKLVTDDTLLILYGSTYVTDSTNLYIDAGALKFRLASVDGYTEYTAFNDQYRIVGVKVTFCPSQRESLLGHFGDDGGAPAKQIYGFTPRICWAIDLDDATTQPLTKAGLIALRERPYSKTTDFNRPVSVWLRPRALGTAQSGSGTASYLLNRKLWLDTNNGTVDHFGLKYYVY